MFQCALPVFDGLFPEPYNSVVLDLLFLCAHWHALAKLRMHTDQTLELLDDITISLGCQFRFFVDTVCPDFKTRELPREAAARTRRSKKPSTSASAAGVVIPRPDIVTGNDDTANASTSQHLFNPISMPNGNIDPSPSSSNPVLPTPDWNLGESDPIPTAGPSTAPPKAPGPTRRLKSLNLNTYKYHSLGDYADTIRKYGTTDSYSTELVRCLFSTYILIYTITTTHHRVNLNIVPPNHGIPVRIKKTIKNKWLA